MSLSSKFVGLPNRLKLAIKISIILIASSYFIFHTINGENGARSYIIVKRQITIQQGRLSSLKELEENLERKVKLLNHKAIDLDLLEERCRIILGYAFPCDIIFDASTIY
jgi:cell division protein FtsB